ncbi:MAG: aspartate--tRNA ligase [Actinomycetota bacterium]|nr:aspartate--tRNA ligase [Actinomycetota bacterium]
MIRTHDAGALRADDIGTTVTLAGWVARRRDHGGVTFLDLRDGSGRAQVVVRESDLGHAVRSEYCLKVTGEVRRRPEGNENPGLATGEVEVAAADVEVLSESAPLPFPVEGGTGEVADEVRLKYRYLDLRREGPARALRLRSRAVRTIRAVMDEQGFYDIETPDLTRSTPEGARDFLVPVRLQPGHWYALPQSPQLFKQLLMVGGLERYYQIARCFRDEDFRADRQPEFTQLDVEMSFADEQDVLGLTERVITRLWGELAGYDVPLPLPRMSYEEAMRRFGIDRPDLRFGVELVDLTDYFRDTPFRVFQQGPGGHVGAVVMPGGAALARRELDAWQEWARSRGAKGLAYVLVQEDGTLGGPVSKNLSEAERSGLAARVGASPGDCVFFAADRRAEALALLAATRQEIGRRCGLIDESRREFVWIVDFPMFEADGEGGWTAIHHPFTAPTPDWADTFQDDPARALSRAYDLVLNGSELGGGSIRIHRAEMQQRVFDVIGLGKEQAEEKFGFLLEAFQYGPPPHGGIALGIDRLAAVLADVDSIREVIAFPKTASGSDPLTGAPTPITAEQRKEAGIDAAPPAPALPRPAPVEAGA